VVQLSSCQSRALDQQIKNRPPRMAFSGRLVITSVSCRRSRIGLSCLQPFSSRGSTLQPLRSNSGILADVVGEPSHPRRNILFRHGFVPENITLRDIGRSVACLRGIRDVRHGLPLGKKAPKLSRSGKSDGVSNRQVCARKKGALPVRLAAPFYALDRIMPLPTRGRVTYGTQPWKRRRLRGGAPQRGGGPKGFFPRGVF